MRHLFIFGLGYSGQAIARLALAHGFTVSGTSRDPQKRAALKAEGINAVDFPLADPTALKDATHVIAAAAPGEQGDPVLNLHQADIPANAWIGYLSTTGVYGNWNGEWVDETSALRATADRSLKRIAAEQAWANAFPQTEIFRLAGIYGLGRSVFDKLRAGKAQRIIKPGHKFGRIHVDDIARTVLAAMAAPAPGAIYNVVDDEPAEPSEVMEEAAELMDIDPPQARSFLGGANLSPMAHSFWADNRKVRNDKVKALLGAPLIYPTYREGLRAIFKEQFGRAP
ncbi:MAG: SDR family oxidoreductase [Alphaproteobacteria bacterium]